MNRVELAEACARRWTELGLNWVVLHGLEGYPERLGRDIDILVEEDEVTMMLASALDIFERNGWKGARPPDIWGWRLVGFGEGEALELHAVSQVEWRELSLVEQPRKIEMLGPFPLDPWASIAKQVVLPAFAGEIDRAAGVLATHDLSAVPKSAVDDPTTKQIMDVLNGSPDPIDAVRRLIALRSKLVRSRWRSDPITALQALASKLMAKVLPLFFSSGLKVYIGASNKRRLMEVLESLDSGRRSIFTAVRVKREPQRSGGVRAVVNRVRGMWSDRIFLGQQAVIFQRWGGPENTVGTEVKPRLADRTSIALLLDFEGGLAGPAVLDVANEPVDQIVQAIWRLVEQGFAEAFPPRR